MRTAPVKHGDRDMILCPPLMRCHALRIGVAATGITYIFNAKSLPYDSASIRWLHVVLVTVVKL